MDALIEILVPATADRAALRVQNPVALDGLPEPQPDIVLVRRPWRGYRDTHPGPDDTLLLVEVADLRLDIDGGAKRELYARAVIREFRVVDLTTNAVLAHRQPGGGRFALESKVTMSGTQDIAGLPGVAVPAAALFG